MQILKQYGYPDSEILYLHKQWKSDKQISGGFVSSILQVVVAYKDKLPTWSGASLPAPSVERAKWRQNLWTLTKATKAQVDELGNKVNSCPQDPLVVERLITMFRPKCIFSHGEGGGWGAPVALSMGTSVRNRMASLTTSWFGDFKPSVENWSTLRVRNKHSSSESTSTLDENQKLKIPRLTHAMLS